ncbi:hypothetical protein COU00_00500 [Candidatus Falkowbacteria bacterium CG10_big_fil_rev_8_21_14_0_10_43_11]|uniref:Uncharacterized protein n=1 Tax=Candidatus Falkowbacteria bacterium CG10_big_fil_rev_8_21_14_0_10_43_11 TaxID=1974568 RepID=A0A2M6WMY3_9BACT|nr:MAG: hypothetical protein COU00_00500 [Candidatus Falkowbacteria bacterium CG10_big_fil_rev_8_21_14_0_10_43_11]
MKGVSITKEHRCFAASAVRKIIFLLREGREQNEAVSQVLADCADEVKPAIEDWHDNARAFSSNEKQLNFWGAMLKIITQG